MSDDAITSTVNRQRFEGISPVAWEHPTDRLALNALKRIPAFDEILKKVILTFGERNISMIYQAQAVKVGPRQYSRIHRQLEQVCTVLDTEVPPLYISQTPIANAGAVGFDKPFIVLNSSLIELANDDEIDAVLGHEVGHIMSEHALYRTMLNLLMYYSQFVPPTIRYGISPVRLALLEWHRKAEVSCDRAGLLATQDLNASLGLLCVMAGGIRGRRDELDIEAFVEQAQEYRDVGGLSAYFRILNGMERTHPFPVIRVAELQNWIDSGEFDNILSGEYHRIGDPQPLDEDAANAARTFSETASKVFEDADRHVTEALMNFVNAARRRVDGED